MRPRSGKRPRLVALELKIEKLVAGGAGIAFTSDRDAVLVPTTAPGDVIRADVDFSMRPARGRVVTVIAPSPMRVSAPCAVAAACGGCDFMHLSPESQRTAHEQILREALPAELRGRAITSHAATSGLAYRTRARLHVRGGERASIGFLAPSSHDLVETDRCLVLTPALEAVRARAAAWFDGSQGRGELSFALGVFPDRMPVVDITWRGELAAQAFGALERAVADRVIAGARVLLEGATRPALFGDPTPVMAGADGEPLVLGAGGFGQASDEGNVLLGKLLREIAAPILESSAESANVVELFAGAGNFTCVLARLGARVTAVESVAGAADAARANLATRGLEAKVVVKDANAFPIPRGLRLVVLDPPRTGAREASRAIATAKPAHVLYVSCDAPTLGRDLSTLMAAGYTVDRIELVEMFPQTSHVETMVLLSRAQNGGKPS